MIIVNHGVNTIEKLKNTPKNCGVETDIRSYGRRLIIHHEPFVKGEDFEDFLKHYSHCLLILNIKSEGIEQNVLDLIKKYRISNYFFLDVTFPFMIKYINKNISQFAVRFSEFESIQTCLNLKDKVEWVFVDNFTKLPIEDYSFTQLSEHFKICIVSPELLKRNEIELTKEIIKKYPVDAVLTDNIEAWK